MCLGAGPYFRPRTPDRDGSLGLLIAPGIFCRFVPGSPADAYLGCSWLALKPVGTEFELFGKSFQCQGQVWIICIG